MTAVGGMLLLAQNTDPSTGLVPDSPAHWLGAVATALSFVNIVGGFLVTGKMIDLFRRDEDPDDYFEAYAVPSAVLLTGLAGAGYIVGHLDTDAGSVGIAAAVCCISASAFCWRRVRAVFASLPSKLTCLPPLSAPRLLASAQSRPSPIRRVSAPGTSSASPASPTASPQRRPTCPSPAGWPRSAPPSSRRR